MKQHVLDVPIFYLKMFVFKHLLSLFTGVSVSTEEASGISATQTPKPSSQVSVAFARVPLSSNQENSKRDQGTSPVQFLSYDQPEPRSERFQPVHVEVGHRLHRSSVPQAGLERDQERRDSTQQSSSNLDQLWQRFCARWSLEESRPVSDREASLLERLERLSRLIHNTRDENLSEVYGDPDEKRGRSGGDERKTSNVGGEDLERRVRGGRKAEGEAQIPQRTQRLQTEEASPPADEDSSTSSFSHASSQSQLIYPADREESETLSTAGSMSTVDTARLIRAFGAHRVQHVKTSSGLRKLYNTINRQKDGREQRRGRDKEPPQIICLSETTGTDESVSLQLTTKMSQHPETEPFQPSLSYYLQTFFFYCVEMWSVTKICVGAKMKHKKTGF